MPKIYFYILILLLGVIGCKKNGNYKQESIKLSVNNTNGSTILTWDQINVSNFVRYEVFASYDSNINVITDKHKIVKSINKAITNSTTVAELDIQDSTFNNNVFDKIYYKVAAVLSDRTLSSPILSANSQVIYKKFFPFSSSAQLHYNGFLNTIYLLSFNSVGSFEVNGIDINNPQNISTVTNVSIVDNFANLIESGDDILGNGVYNFTRFENNKIVELSSSSFADIKTSTMNTNYIIKALKVYNNIAYAICYDDNSDKTYFNTFNYSTGALLKSTLLNNFTPNNSLTLNMNKQHTHIYISKGENFGFDNACYSFSIGANGDVSQLGYTNLLFKSGAEANYNLSVSNDGLFVIDAFGHIFNQQLQSVKNLIDANGFNTVMSASINKNGATAALCENTSLTSTCKVLGGASFNTLLSSTSISNQGNKTTTLKSFFNNNNLYLCAFANTFSTFNSNLHITILKNTIN
jgi:hypothetical protein